MKTYNLSSQEFADIIGVDIRSFLNLLKPEEKDGARSMKWAECHTFLVWAGLADPILGKEEAPEKFREPETFEDSLARYFKRHDIKIGSFCENVLGRSRSGFYKLKSENPRAWKELILSKIDINE
jgi:hypothetical protein